MMSEAEAQAILNTARGVAKAAYTPWLAIFVGDPLSGGTEVPGGVGYTRQSIAFDAPAGKLMLNSGPVAFGTPTGTWGTPVTHWAIMDASVGGTVRHAFEMAGSDEQRTIVAGTTPPVLGPGTISLSVP